MRGKGAYSTDAFTKIVQSHLGDLPWQTLSWLTPKVCVVSGHSHLNGKTTTSLWRTYPFLLNKLKEKEEPIIYLIIINLGIYLFYSM